MHVIVDCHMPAVFFVQISLSCSAAAADDDDEHIIQLENCFFSKFVENTINKDVVKCFTQLTIIEAK